MIAKLTGHRNTQGAVTKTAPGSLDAFDHQPGWATVKLTYNRDEEKTGGGGEGAGGFPKRVVGAC